MFPWLQAFQLLTPLLTGPKDHPHTVAAQNVAAAIPAMLHPATPKMQQDAHLGQIFSLLLSSGLISPNEVPPSVVTAPTPAA